MSHAEGSGAAGKDPLKDQKDKTKGYKGKRRAGDKTEVIRIGKGPEKPEKKKYDPKHAK